MVETRMNSGIYTIDLESATRLPRASEYLTETAASHPAHEYVNVAETNFQSNISPHVAGTEGNLSGAEYNSSSDTRLSVHVTEASLSLPHEYANVTELPPSYNDVISCSSTDPPSYSMVVNVSI